MKLTVAAIIILNGILISGSGHTAENPFGIGNPWNGLDELGIGWCRAGAGATAFDWRRMEPEPGKLTFDTAEKEMQNWLDPYGIKFIGLLGYTPDWASSAPEDEENKRGYPPKDLRDWSKYIEQTAGYFRSEIPYYEVWNEQDIGFWKGTCNEYTQLLKSAFLAVKRGDPNARVAFGGLAGVDLPFIEECYQHGAGAYFDAMAVHPYQWGETFNDGWFMTEMKNLRQLMLEHGDDKEILLTEFGWATDGSSESEAIQARLMAQAILTCLRMKEEARVEIFCPFTVRDWGGPGYGFLRHDNTKKPVWVGYSTLIAELLGKPYQGRIELDDNIRAYCYAPDASSPAEEFIVALWCSDKERREIDIEVDSPAIVSRTMLGEERTIESQSGSAQITIAPEPIYIHHVGREFLEPMIPVERVEKPQRKPQVIPPVWMSLDIPDDSRRASVKRGEKETLELLLYNDSDERTRVKIEAELRNSSLSRPVTAKKTASLEPWERLSLPLSIRVPKDATLELSDLIVTGQTNGTAIPPLAEKVRVTDGRAIEFLANSQIDEKYLFETQGGGGAPSVRFGGEYWTYMFNLTCAKKASITLDVGAHEAGYWKVEASNNHRKWKTILEGHGNRDRHETDLSEFTGGPVFIRISGDEQHRQQLGELVLVGGD